MHTTKENLKQWEFDSNDLSWSYLKGLHLFHLLIAVLMLSCRQGVTHSVPLYIDKLHLYPPCDRIGHTRVVAEARKTIRVDA